MADQTLSSAAFAAGFRRRAPEVKGSMPPWVAAVLLSVCALSLVALLCWEWLGPGLHQSCQSLLGSFASDRVCNAGVDKLLVYSWVLAFFPVILLLERRIPADPNQSAFSPGLMVDVMWFITFPLLGVWLPNLFEGFLQSTLGTALAGYRLWAIAALPLSMQLVLVILVADFLAWFGHLLRHKVPVLWEFHKIHHAQVQLNYFSTRRIHPLDTMAQGLVRFLPWTLLGLNVALPGYLIWNTFLRLYEMFVHSNLHTNLGPLRYVLVTPQSHRVHHSMEEPHIDTNYGDFLSIWDYMFATQVRDYSVYPRLGVHDKACPNGTATSVGGALVTLGKELVYPLQALVTMLRPRGAGGAP